MKDGERVPSAQLHAEGNDETGGAIPAADAGQEAEKAEEVKENGWGEDEFEQLIKGKYASRFAEKVQRIIDKRFKQTKELEARVKEGNEFMQRLAVLCEGDSSKPEELYKLVEQLAKGEKRALPDPSRAQEMAKRAKRDYPDFDPDRALEDPEFCALVEMGLDYSRAYALTHLEGIKEQALKEGARRALLSVSTMGSRPAEGELSQSAPSGRRGVASLSSSEVRNLIERASKGEKIKFKDI